MTDRNNTVDLRADRSRDNIMSNEIQNPLLSLASLNDKSVKTLQIAKEVPRGEIDEMFVQVTRQIEASKQLIRHCKVAATKLNRASQQALTMNAEPLLEIVKGSGETHNGESTPEYVAQ